jgi:hypothetical protein
MKKVCTKCGEEKDISEFYENQAMVDKHNSWCKLCCNALSRLNNKINKEKYSKRKKEHYQKNKEKIKLRNSIYVSNRREKTNENMRVWWQKNKDRVHAKKRETAKKYYYSHLDQMKQKRIKNKEHHSEYYQKYKIINKESIRTKNKIRRETLPDYIVAEHIMPVNEMRKIPEYLETKRILIQIKRELKKVS